MRPLADKQPCAACGSSFSAHPLPVGLWSPVLQGSKHSIRGAGSRLSPHEAVEAERNLEQIRLLWSPIWSFLPLVPLGKPRPEKKGTCLRPQGTQGLCLPPAGCPARPAHS